MERAAALKLLPDTYRLALGLRNEGLDPEAIARILDIPVEAVAPLLMVGEAKLARLMSGVDGPDPGSRTP